MAAQRVPPVAIRSSTTNARSPGSFRGFRNGTNFAPIANAMGGPNMKPRASIPIVNAATFKWPENSLPTLKYKDRLPNN
ncbi:hypothetical protein Leryth_003275 [Lithospermum erythrorhizon]|nr:hypothetical protein Leryth_003275 [Lithospermum erythrorhizon]